MGPVLGVSGYDMNSDYKWCTSFTVQAGFVQWVRSNTNFKKTQHRF